MQEVEGEPSENQGAVDTAIRIIKRLQGRERVWEIWHDLTGLESGPEEHMPTSEDLL